MYRSKDPIPVVMMLNSKATLGSAILLPIVINLFAAPTQAASFRVNPYLQQPSADGMAFTWFAETNQPATLTLTGSTLSDPLVFNSTPSLEPLLAYTTAEQTQEIEGLDPGSWLLNNENYKYTVDVR
ncbi:MAG: metallophosphoesterase, partial [Cyanobacteria bacterium P01_D01_bin.56]